MTSYKDSGVDIDAADAAKKSMKSSVDSGDPRVLNTLGAFASLVEGSFPGYDDPILVLKTEEPGSKQKLAFQHGMIKSICADTINHLINDIAVMGATPLYVQDLIACGKIEKDVVTKIVGGFAAACKEQDCVLTGGETTEQPGVINPGTYVLAANIVGVVERSKIIDGSSIQEGDVVLAVASNGLHTNGYTLVRSLIDKNADLLKKDVDGKSFLDAIMKTHTCYYQSLKDLVGNADVHGLAHITGGGIQGNAGRILPKKLSMQIDLSALRIPKVFHALREEGDLADEEMLKTFNMGAGIIAVVGKDSVDALISHFKKTGHEAYTIGEVVSGDQSVQCQNTLTWD